MTAERDLDDILESRLRDVPPLRPGFLGDVFDQTRTIPQRRHRWPLHVLEDRTEHFTDVSAQDAVPTAVPATNGQTPARGSTMFSALKFIAASVIVALFGGFLLTSVFTTQQSEEVPPAAVSASPTTTITSEPTKAPTTSIRSDILPGVALTVEEVEPSVYRVDNDGLRDLAKANDTDIVAGHDGGIWLLRPQRFVRLGGDEWYRWAAKKPIEVRDFGVAPDGTVWTIRSQHPPKSEYQSFIESFDGEGWTTRQKSEGAALAVTSDSTVWAIWQDPEQEFRTLFGYLDEDGWQTLGPAAEERLLLVAGPDDIWAIGGGGFGPSRVVRFVDGAWQQLVGIDGTEATWQRAEDPVGADAEQFGVSAGMVGIGPDGTFWAVSGFLNPPDLVRFDGSEWSRWSLDPEFYPGPDAAFEVAPDTSLWFAVGAGPWGSETPCGGVGHFDGVTWDRYISGLCVDGIDITADGSVWLLAADPDDNLRHVYVITPEALAASA